MPNEGAISSVDVHEEHDGCLCDAAVTDRELVGDEDLPPASGGVEAGPSGHDQGAELDGCDLDFEAGEVSLDETLPPASGGVA